MADIAKSIAKYIAEQLGHQLCYVFSYESNVDGLKTDVEKLELVRHDIQHSIDDAKSKGEEIYKLIIGWLKKVDTIVNEAKEFQNKEGHAKAECSCGHFPNLWERHQLSTKAKEIAQRISGVIKERELITRISYQPRLLIGITSSYARGYEALGSRSSFLNNIIQTLKDAQVCKVGVYGMGGVGKSTLIKELAWKVVQDGSFGTVVSANVSNSPDVKRIQAEIAESLGMKKFNEETQAKRASHLRKRISNEESILIIMDDIWEMLDLAEVGVPFGDDHKGCKLLFTSRNLIVLTGDMGVEEKFCFKLEVLSEEESWSLFEKKVGDAVKDNNLRPTALKVAKACGDLPLLLITVANALKNKGLPAWNDALQQLTRFNHKGMAATVYSAIELSYNHLVNDELKSLFLLLGSMGQTTSWTANVLIFFWSLSLFEDVDSLAHARNRLSYLVTELKSACLLLEEGEEVEAIKMHDLVHEVARKRASRDRPIFTVKQYSELKEWPEVDKKCYRMFVPECHIHYLPKSLECPELEILEVGSQDNFLKVPEHFLVETKELKNLYLSGMDCIPSLTSSLSHLRKLRAIHLRECMLEDIAILAELKNLEILDLSTSEIRELPVVIGKLTSLRMLCLSYVSGLRAIPAKLISSLTRLEELYMRNTFIHWEEDESHSQSKKASLGELRNLHQLKALEITIQDVSVLPKDLLIFGQLGNFKIFIGDELKLSSSSRTFSKTMKLNQGKAKNIHLDKGIKLLLSNVEELCLTNLSGVRNVLYQFSEEGFPQLSHLGVQSSDDIQYIIDSKEWHHSREAFPKLESLVLYSLPNMRKICNGPIPVQSFTELKVIKVKGCYQLENVFSYSMVKDLSRLVEVEVSNCEIMSEIIIKEDAEIDKIEFPRLLSLTIDCLPNLASFYSKTMSPDMDLRSVIEYEDDSTIPLPLFDEKISFPNLDSLKISSINLRKIWDDKLYEHSYIHKLKSLKIYGCVNLKLLFPSSIARGLVNLQHLSIDGCGKVEEIFSTEEMMVNLPSATISFSNDETLECPNLKELDVFDCDELDIFATKSGICQDVSIDHQLLFSLEKINQSVEKLSLSSKDITLICNDQQSDVDFYKVKALCLHRFENSSDEILTSFLQRFTNLEELKLFASSFLSIPHIEHIVTSNKLKTLKLHSLWHLENICQEHSQTEQILQNLQTLKVFFCLTLKIIAPSSVQFQNLNTMHIRGCDALVNIISSRTAKSLLTLKRLVIRNCKMIEEIVVSEDDDASEIAFMKLEFLQLECLPRLTSFCNGNLLFKFPLLKTLFVIECPMMETFSQGILRAPLLTCVRTKEDEWHWNGDLNTTVIKIFRQSVSKDV